MPVIPAHERNSDLVSIYAVAKEVQGIPYLSAKRRARAGFYGPTCCDEAGVECVSKHELILRGILAVGQEVRPRDAAKDLLKLYTREMLDALLAGAAEGGLNSEQFGAIVRWFKTVSEKFGVIDPPTIEERVIAEVKRLAAKYVSTAEVSTKFTACVPIAAKNAARRHKQGDEREKV